jgi:hypothetical protein
VLERRSQYDKSHGSILRRDGSTLSHAPQALNECTPIATRFHQLRGESGRIVRYLPPGDCSGASSACSRVMWSSW